MGASAEGCGSPGPSDHARGAVLPAVQAVAANEVITAAQNHEQNDDEKPRRHGSLLLRRLAMLVIFYGALPIPVLVGGTASSRLSG